MKIRTWLFFACMTVTSVFFYVICSPIMLLMPSYVVVKGVQTWGRVTIFLLRWVGGIKTELRGLENFPKGNFIVASKHQSELETLVLGYIFKNPVFILKKELLAVPFFGWYVKRSGMIPVDRKAAGGAMKQMLSLAVPVIKAGARMVIFPEGTRVPVDAKYKFKQGVSLLYKEANIPVVPVALNTGYFWGKGRLNRTGTTVIEFCKPIEAGLEPDVFLQQLEHVILTKSDELAKQIDG